MYAGNRTNHLVTAAAAAAYGVMKLSVRSIWEQHMAVSITTLAFERSWWCAHTGWHTQVDGSRGMLGPLEAGELPSCMLPGQGGGAGLRPCPLAQHTAALASQAMGSIVVDLLQQPFIVPKG